MTNYFVRKLEEEKFIFHRNVQMEFVAGLVQTTVSWHALNSKNLDQIQI